MPLLSAADPLPGRPRRVLVSGPSGSGKSTLARQIATTLALPYTELDSLHHGPGWVPRPEFESDVRRLAASDAWVTEWQYSAVRALMFERADTVVFLLLPKWVSFSRVVRRTVRRARHEEVLWNGNVEPPLRTVLTDPDHIIRWHRRSYASNRARYAEVLGGPHLDRVTVVRLTSTREVERWISGPLAAVAPASRG